MKAFALREWTREDLYRIAKAGVFRFDERLELIDGQIVTKMSPQGNPHIICVLLVEDWLRDQVGKEFHVRTQTPFALGPRDEPEPDVMVVFGRARDYSELPPAESSLARRGRRRLDAYARPVA